MIVGAITTCGWWAGGFHSAYKLQNLPLYMTIDSLLIHDHTFENNSRYFCHFSHKLLFISRCLAQFARLQGDNSLSHNPTAHAGFCPPSGRGGIYAKSWVGLYGARPTYVISLPNFRSGSNSTSQETKNNKK